MFSDALVTLMVDDLPRSVRFYREALGFEGASDPEGETAEFSGAGMRLRLHRRRREVEGTGSGTSAVGLSVPDIETAAAVIGARGVAVGRILRAGTRRVALFDDPDGNHWYLYDALAGPQGAARKH
jgi:catechol 2,3-dioxygenase-like lactoylglutathione lyase family enzyme